MKTNNTKRNFVLGVLFLLPVAFLLMLYPAKHNYTPLDIINNNVLELTKFSSDSEEKVQFAEYITVLGFIGNNPLDNIITASNLKELVYDKFKGFKKFQIVIVAPLDAKTDVERLQKEIATYEDMRFWHYVYGSESEINQLYSSLKIENPLKGNLSTNDVFIIDKDLNQRGRIDARSEKEVETNKPITTLSAYNCIEVDIIKNKMSEDVRILFTEYRQKRKGKFDSTSRRANDLKQNDE
jgi:hypothetical protein